MIRVNMSCSDPGLVLIVPHRSGVIYTNQCGGIRCWHPELEGILIPVRPWNDHKRVSSDPLLNHFEYKPESASTRRARISAWLEHHALDELFEPRADEEAMEAWVPVIVRRVNDEYSPTHAFEGMPGILTYQNSD